MSSFGRRSFLAGMGSAAASAATLPWLQAIGYAQAPRAGARVPPPGTRPRRLRSPAARRRSSSIWAAPSIRACTSPARRWPTRKDSAPTSRARSRSSASPSSAIPAATSSPDTTGSTASARRRNRPTVLERAWNSIETNQFGTNEFIDWCRIVGTEPLLGLNFGTGTRRNGRRLRRVLQRRPRHEVERAAALARLRPAAQRALLVPRQRDGRALADRADAGARIRPQGARRRRSRCA